jgi:hypothetical protein
MNRLQTELHRLYLPESSPSADGDPALAMVDAQGRVRAMTMELTRPADWQVLSRVWQGVQAELALPAPAIAVSGIDGLQLWFSLAEAVPAALARVFLDALRRHFLAGIDPTRIRLRPDAEATWALPGRRVETGDWSAFVAPDLAPVFADTPWLDIPPGDDGQAALLSGLVPTKPVDFAAALERLKPPNADVDDSRVGGQALSSGMAAEDSGTGDARRFLRRVMNDESAPLALRIEAAKALLPSSSDRPVR